MPRRNLKVVLYTPVWYGEHPFPDRLFRVKPVPLAGAKNSEIRCVVGRAKSVDSTIAHLNPGSYLMGSRLSVEKRSGRFSVP